MTQEVFKERFVEIIKSYNDVIMNKTLVIQTESDILRSRAMDRCIRCVYSICLDDEEPRSDACSKCFEHEGTPQVLAYILKKLDDMKQRIHKYDNQLNIQYKRFKQYYDWFSIFIIFTSCSLSFFEGASLMVGLPPMVTTLTSLACGTSITFATALVKFKNYKENMEKIVMTKEKIQNCHSKMYTLDKEIKLFLNSKLDESSGSQEDHRVFDSLCSHPMGRDSNPKD